MSDAKHTPAPWRVDRCYRTGFTIFGGTQESPSCVVDTQDDDGRYGTIRNESDARLIAAAPDLLAALIDLTDRVEKIVMPDQSTPCTIHARAAIAKAEGES